MPFSIISACFAPSPTSLLPLDTRNIPPRRRPPTPSRSPASAMPHDKHKHSTRPHSPASGPLLGSRKPSYAHLQGYQAIPSSSGNGRSSPVPQPQYTGDPPAPYHAPQAYYPQQQQHNLGALLPTNANGNGEHDHVLASDIVSVFTAPVVPVYDLFLKDARPC